MKLLDSDVKQFQQIYKQYFHETLNDDEARKQLTNLVTQVKIVYHPISRTQLEAYIRQAVSKGRSDA